MDLAIKFSRLSNPEVTRKYAYCVDAQVVPY